MTSAVVERVPKDPKQREQFEVAQAKLARTQADQQAAKVRADEELKRIDAQNKHDAKLIAAKKKAEKDARAAIQAKRDAARKKYMETPLNAEEKGQLDRLEAMCKGRGPYDRDSMKLLADLRVRAKLVAEEKKEAKP